MNKKRPNLSQERNVYYMYGKHSVLAALKNNNRNVINVLCNKDVFNEYKTIINKHKYEIVDNDVLAKKIGIQNNHQGIAAKVKTIFKTQIEDLKIEGDDYKIAILDQITDPQNIGAIIRSAAAFGIKSMILPADNTPGENGAMAKAAVGTIESINIIQVSNLKSAMLYLKKQGFWILGLDSAAKDDITHESKLLSGKVAIALGSEDKGLRRLTKETCDYIVKIPMSSEVESLNVSNAAAIIFHLAFVND